MKSEKDESRKLVTYIPQIAVRAAGKLWQLERAASLEQLWEAMTESDSFADERLPYWTELWPSSVVLSNWLEQQKNNISGRCCLDMGCGLGLTALVARSLGASVVGMDYEFEALNHARSNAVLNAVPAPLWVVMDWRKPAVQRGRLQCIWGADIMYEKRFVLPVIRFLEHALTKDGIAWLAEPGRSIYDAFLDMLQSRGWQGRAVYSETVEPLYVPSVPVPVNIWELRRPGTEPATHAMNSDNAGQDA
ncbi:MAG: 50S ribosomal protein L11 methyltransferase [Desulfovibrio sp.]|nr:50S ribosomal protein L11 methyltransferase [Desulfovibrio sp.]